MQTTIGDFVIEEKLGRGAFKTVYRATNRGFGKNAYPQRVAVCVPHTQDEEAQGLLRHERRMLEALDHPGIVRIFGVERDRDTLYAVMELAEGETIAERLKRAGGLPLAEAVGIARQMADALDYAHGALVFHRDVKPANVKLVPDAAAPGGVRVKLLDFGLARLLAHSQYLASTRVGSVAFMAPEQFSGAAGMNADVWALGVTFFQMVTNALPFLAREESELVRKILYEAPDLDALEGVGDARLAGVVRRALEKEPSKRYPKAGEFAADLEAVLRHAAAVSPLEGELEVLLRAHYPLVFVVSHEEERVLRALERVRQVMSAKQPMGLFVWSETAGLRDAQGRPVAGVRSAGDPLTALRAVIESPQEGVYVLLDMHRHFTPVSVRLVRDAIWTVKRQRKSLVFLSPEPVLPPELQAEATLLSFPLPDADALGELAVELQRETAGDAGAVLDGPLRERLGRALLGLTRREAARVLRKTALAQGGLGAGCVQAVVAEKRQAVRKSGVLEFCEPDVSFEDVGGLENLKAWFAARREAFGPQGARFGLSAPKGAVLAGVPGCGKSLSAKALAADWGVPLLRLDMGRIRGSRLGESEGRLRAALQMAEVASPCVLWIDELEKAFAGMGQAQDSGVSQRLFGGFLTWLEDRRSQVFVVATANDVTRLPPEFARKGRFDEMFYVGLPNAAEREAIWRVHLRRPRRIGLTDSSALVAASEGHTGAEIAEAVVSAMYRAFEDGARPVGQADLAASLAEGVPMSVSRAGDIRRLMAWGQQFARPASR
jgi:AAA+ superfamily predicted ATPase